MFMHIISPVWILLYWRFYFYD